jgi:G3E family GTPase
MVTGFLGAGKTTFIADLLSTGDRGDTLVILNELGDGGGETALLGGGPLAILDGGCACCERAADLLQLLRDVVRGGRDARPRRIVLETTGLARPDRLAELVRADPLLRHHARLREVVVVVDVLHAAATVAAQPEAAAQIAAADRLVLTKALLATAEQVAAAARLVRALNATARLEGAPEPPVVGTADLAVASPGGVGHLEAVATRTLQFDTPLDWQVFGVWLTLVHHAHASRLLRFKASIDAGGPGPVLLDAVQATVHPPRHLLGWDGAARASRLTFVTRGLDPALLERSLRVFQDAFAARRAQRS